MQTPDEWLADFEAKVADLQQKATDFKNNIEAAGTTERSPDGTVTVTVAPSGALLDLHLTPEAMAKTAEALRDQILTATRTARQRAAQEVATAFTPLGGTSDIVQRIPTPDEAPQQTPPKPTPRDETDYSDTGIYRDEDRRW
ncbi:YbaB/EbfC family nucleoid-associated protein [Actinokineospora bangkokensis]|uniref:YbaB/EbfC DNA-binding family protein n=1 Tax=Actinokineospora bangkokensis TaxID=1193682 RepID=A0A1Q9LTF2_9PSEU|nr:YbaB/EbfC family nucleoid-associated protein [Actinokineospora bangkokensis]OLR95279.1 hypothetical protein BJP25_07270 [Actinokineospora bangkokensis]